jgi:hypothetical protein
MVSVSLSLFIGFALMRRHVPRRDQSNPATSLSIGHYKELAAFRHPEDQVAIFLKRVVGIARELAGFV